MLNMSLELIIFSGTIFLIALVLLYRIFIGPNVIDRVAAADSINVLVGIVMVILGCIERKAIYIDLGLTIILVGFLGVLLISKYLGGKL